MTFEPPPETGLSGPAPRLDVADVLENIFDAFVALDRDWRIVYANRQASALNQKPPEAFLGRTHWEEWPFSVGTEVERQYRRAVQERVDVRFEYHHVAGATDVWLEIAAHPVEDGLHVFLRDITRRKQAEESLRESNARRGAILQAALDCIITMDDQGRVVEWNPAAERTFGHTRAQTVGQPLAELIIPEALRGAHTRGLAHYLETGAGPLLNTRAEVNALHMTGAQLLVELTIIPLAWKGRRLFTAYVRDITERKRAEEALATAYRREVTLNRIGQAIRGTTSPERVQAAAVRLLGEALGADRAFYSAFDLARGLAWIGEDFRRADLPSLEGEYQAAEFQRPPADCYPAGLTLTVTDAQGSALPAPRGALRAAISVPLQDAGALVGTLTVAMADGPRAWTGAEVSLVETVAVQTRAALDAARVQQREHRIASILQAALQPSVPALVPGLDVYAYTKPALDEASIGGDFFDVFGLDEGDYALVIGDVSGKGLAAAAQVATVRNMMRFVLYRLGREPDALAAALAELNRVLTVRDLLVGFVTLLVAVYDARARTLRYVSCGHEPGLILRASAGTVEQLPPTGPPVGIDAEAAYAERMVPLAPEDTVMFYTDGLTEEGPSRREMLGVEGLSRLLRISQGAPADAPSMSQRILAQVQSYAGGVLRDDACLILARCGRAAPPSPDVRLPAAGFENQ